MCHCKQRGLSESYFAVVISGIDGLDITKRNITCESNESSINDFVYSLGVGCLALVVKVLVTRCWC